MSFRMAAGEMEHVRVGAPRGWGGSEWQRCTWVCTKAREVACTTDFHALRHTY